MALSQAQLLKRKQKKNKARTEKAKEIHEMSQMRHIPKWPIVAAYAPFYSRDEHTMQYAVIVRKVPNGLFAVGLFLVDVLCLGVKDCFMKMLLPPEFAEMLENIEMNLPMDDVSPSYVASFIHEAVDYSKRLGFEPGGHYPIVKKFLEGIPRDTGLTFSFGENGKPVYIPGPYDSPEIIKKALATLNRSVGKDHYKFIIPPKEREDVMDDEIEAYNRA